MEGFFDLVSNVWNQGLLGVSISHLIVSLVILIISLVLRGVVSSICIKWLERLTAQTDSELVD